MNKLINFITALLLAKIEFSVEYIGTKKLRANVRITKTLHEEERIVSPVPSVDCDRIPYIGIKAGYEECDVTWVYEFDLTEDTNVPETLPKLEC